METPQDKPHEIKIASHHLTLPHSSRFFFSLSLFLEAAGNEESCDAIHFGFNKSSHKVAVKDVLKRHNVRTRLVGHPDTHAGGRGSRELPAK